MAIKIYWTYVTRFLNRKLQYGSRIHSVLCFALHLFHCRQYKKEPKMIRNEHQRWKRNMCVLKRSSSDWLNMYCFPTVVKHNQVTIKKKPNRFTHNLQKQKIYMLDEWHSVESTSFSYYLCYSNSFLEMLPCLICKTIIYVLRTSWGISRTCMRKMIILATISNKNKTSIIILINESMNLDVLIKQTN